MQRRFELHRNRRQNGHGGVINTPLEPPDYVRVDLRIEGKRLLGQVAPFPAVPNLFAKTPQY